MRREAGHPPLVVYVKGGRHIVMYDPATKTTKLISQMPDNILAMHVRWDALRASDRDEHQHLQINEDNENVPGTAQQKLIISAVDDSENITLFSYDLGKSSTATTISCNAKQFQAAPKKPLFAFGYEYHIRSYANNIVLSTDYGVMILGVL